MKKHTIYPLLIVLMVNMEIEGQNNSSDLTASYDLITPDSKVETSKSFDFIELYNINLTNAKKAKVLADAEAYSSPALSSVKTEFTIPKGSIVKTYNYFEKDASWAVNYNERWCFISATLLVPLQENKYESAVVIYDEAPKLLTNIQIKYPPDAKRNGISGKVYLKILVSKTGSVDQAEVITSVQGLDEAALEAVKKIKFKPAKTQGRPIDTWITIPINFELTD